MVNVPAKQLIKDNLNIPTLPKVLVRVGQLIDDPECGTRDIGEVVARDAPLAARVLRIANSAFYGLRERCLSTEQACSVLGLRVLRNVVMQAAVIQRFDHLRNKGFDLDGMWRHSILTAQTSAYLARRSRRALDLEPEEFHACGLLHDIGKVVMLDSLGNDYLECYNQAHTLGDKLHHAEERRFNYAHTDVGAMLAIRWGLPTAAVSAIHFHHGPLENLRDDPVVTLVANANLLAHRVTDGDHEAAEATIDQETADFLELERRDVYEIVNFAVEVLGQIEV